MQQLLIIKPNPRRPTVTKWLSQKAIICSMCQCCTGLNFVTRLTRDILTLGTLDEMQFIWCLITGTYAKIQSWAVRWALGCVNSCPWPEGVGRRDSRTFWLVPSTKVNCLLNVPLPACIIRLKSLSAFWCPPPPPWRPSTACDTLESVTLIIGQSLKAKGPQCRRSNRANDARTKEGGRGEGPLVWNRV